MDCGTIDQEHEEDDEHANDVKSLATETSNLDVNIESPHSARSDRSNHSATLKNMRQNACLTAAQVVLTKEEVQRLIDARKLNDDYLDKELRIVLIGKTGVGKSATANTIIGENFFKSEFGGSSVTQVCKEKHAKTHGKQILVVDTPGIFDTETDPDELETEIRKCINIAAPGPHAVLFVMRLNDRYKKEDYEALKIFLSYFGEEMLDYVIVVFTFADIIQAKRISLDEYLEKSPPKLRELLKLFDNRRIPFNNEFEGLQRDPQVQGLLTMIEGLKTANVKASYYNDHNFEYAEAQLKEKEKEIEERVKQDYYLKKKEHERNLKQEHNKNMLEVRLQYEKEISQLRKTVRGQTSILVKGFKLKLHQNTAEEKIPRPDHFDRKKQTPSEKKVTEKK